MTVVFMFCEGYIQHLVSSSFIPLDTESNEGMEERKEKREGGPHLDLSWVVRLGLRRWR